jgi:hypothetical protein
MSTAVLQCGTQSLQNGQCKNILMTYTQFNGMPEDGHLQPKHVTEISRVGRRAN